MPAPVVTGSKAQPKTGTQITGGSLQQAKIKARAKVAMQHRVQKRMLAEKRGGSAPKTSTPKPSAPRPASSATPAPSVAEPVSRAQAEINLEYQPNERKLIDAIGQGKAHGSTIDRVYAGYQQAHADAEAKVQAATAGALAGMQHGTAEALQQSTQVTGAAQGAAATQNATTQADTGQSADVAAQVAQALASVVQGGAIQQNVTTQQGQDESAALQRLGMIQSSQTNQFKENTNAYVNQLGRDQMDLGQRKSAAVTARQGELDDAEAAAIQQQITNALAEKSLLQKTDAANKDYDIRLKDLGVKLQDIQARKDISAADNTSAQTVAGLNNDNDLEVARLQGKLTRREGETQRAFQARQNQANRKNARIIAARKPQSGVGSAGASGKSTYRNSDGQTVTLTADKQIEWRGRRSTYTGIRSAAAREFQSLGGKKDEKAFNEVIRKVKAKYKGAPPEVVRAAVLSVRTPGKLGGSYEAALERYFFGLVPAGMTSKSFVKLS
jgi:hypothetical protein